MNISIGADKYAIASKLFSQITVDSDYSMWLLHENSGVDIIDSGGMLGNQTINGTTAAIWGVQNWFSPFGDHQLQINSTAAKAFGDLSTLKGQMIFFVDFYAVAAPSAKQNVLLMYGRNGGAGQHALKFSIETSGRFQIQHSDTAGVIRSSNTGNYGDVCDSVNHSLVGVIDVVNGIIFTYVDSVLQSTVSIDKEAIGAEDSRGWGLMANITWDTPSFNNNLGAGGIAGCRINRLGIIKTNSDHSPNIGKIAQGLTNTKHEMPWEFDGV